MKKISFLLVTLLLCSQLKAGYSPYLKEWTNKRYAPEYSADEHYRRGTAFFMKKKWKEAIPQFLAVANHFEDIEVYSDALFYAAVSYYYIAELDMANRYFSEYLASAKSLQHYEKALTFKFHIAEYYTNGRRKHLFGRRLMPTVLGTLDEAVTIYDEVIAALSNRELAIRALYGKAGVLRRQKELDESIEVYKTLVHRYEVHELAEKALLHISEIYLDRAMKEAQNPDLLALAELNLRSFRRHFPSSPMVGEAEANLLAMKEAFGESLFATASFYQRKSKPDAMKIYLNELLNKYPETEVAKKGRDKIAAL